MKPISTACMVILMLPVMGLAEQQDVASESRDASTALIGTNNFIVGRIGRECLATMGRSESPQQFAGSWQQRNLKYVQAADLYMRKRLEEAQTNGGEEKRQAVLREVTRAVGSNGEATVRGWFDKDGKEAACQRVVKLIDSGAFDVSPKMPMYGELEALVSWAARQSLTSQ